MTPEVKFAAGVHRRPAVTDLRPPEVRMRLRAADHPPSSGDDLRTARGVLASVLLGVCAWILILLGAFIWL